MPLAAKRHRKNRGMPPPATFDIDTLPGSSNLTALARLRGFALDNADFEIFFSAKSLICQGWRLQFWRKTAVVKTYPIPKLGVMRVDSSHHVSATHRAKEERQDAPLLERGGEQAPR
jgi:hypothetical protein